MQQQQEETCAKHSKCFLPLVHVCFNTFSYFLQLSPALSDLSTLLLPSPTFSYQELPEKFLRTDPRCKCRASIPRYTELASDSLRCLFPFRYSLLLVTESSDKYWWVYCTCAHVTILVTAPVLVLTRMFCLFSNENSSLFRRLPCHLYYPFTTCLLLLTTLLIRFTTVLLLVNTCSEKARERERKLEKVREGQRRLEKVEEGRRRLDNVREGQRKLEQV